MGEREGRVGEICESAKKRSVDTKTRAVDQEWTVLILPTERSKPVCLICSETVTIIKNGNVKCHYETKAQIFSGNTLSNPIVLQHRKMNQRTE